MHLGLSHSALLAAPLTVGGQAVIEGVMMRSPKSFSVAVRRKDGSIVVREQPVANFLSRFRPFRWPLLRGAVVLLESLHNGISALNFAADQAMLDEQGEIEAGRVKPPVSATLLAASAGEPARGSAEQGGSSWAIGLTLAAAIVLGLALFVGLPHALTFGIGLLVPGGLDLESAWFHLVDGGFKLAIFVLYIVLIGRLEDIRRLFMYHGAEHMVVHTYEARLPLLVAEARRMSTAHPRCGTSLILWVVALSIFMFAAVFPFLPRWTDLALLNHLIAIVIKILLTLPVAGLAYELQRFAARHPDSRALRALISPGMAMQALTTRTPDDAQLEVALTALRKVLWREAQPAVAAGGLDVTRFSSFEEVLAEVA